MITIYTVSHCSSCRLAKKWLNNQGVEYKEISLLKEGIDLKSLIKVLSLTERGVEDIISKDCKGYEELSLNELLDIIIKNPHLLRRPIIFDEKRLQVGYNADDIRQFIPRFVRQIEFYI